MKAMPFKTASETSVSVQEPQVLCGDRIFEIDQPIETWDYLSELQIVLGVSVDEFSFREQSGLIEISAFSGVEIAMQVECVETSWRGITTIPIQRALGQVAIIEHSVPSGTVAQYLDISLYIILNRPDSAPRGDRVAYLRGSRIYTCSTTWRVGLEGTGGSFPTEAIDFASIGLDENSPWHIRINNSDWDLPFMKSVRLLVNVKHPAAPRILRGRDRGISSLIIYDFILQAVLAASDSDFATYSASDDESLGSVVNYLCGMYLHMDLPSAAVELKEDRSDFLTRLKGATDFLMESEE